MLPSLFLQFTLFAGIGLAQGFSNLGVTKVIDSAQIAENAKSPFENWDVVEGALLSDCNDSISVCGKTGKIKVVLEHKKTIYETTTHTTEDVTTLDTDTVVVTKTEYETTTTSTEGHCRQTRAIIDPEPLVVNVQVTVTSTREFVPVVTAYTTIKQLVYVKAIEQCLVKNKSPAQGSPFISGDPLPQAPVVSSSPAHANDISVDSLVSPISEEVKEKN